MLNWVCQVAIMLKSDNAYADNHLGDYARVLPQNVDKSGVCII